MVKYKRLKVSPCLYLCGKVGGQSYIYMLCSAFHCEIQLDRSA